MNYLAVCVVSASLVAVASTYPSISAQGQTIGDDLESFGHHRVQRQVVPHGPGFHGHGPPHPPMKFCCAKDISMKHTEKFRELFRSCFREMMDAKPQPQMGEDWDLFDPSWFQKHVNRMQCLQQCVAKKNGIVDDDGNVNGDIVIANLTEFMDSEPTLKIIRDTVITSVKDDLKTIGTWTGEDGDTCNPSAIKIRYSIYKNIQLNCPDSSIEDEEECTTLRDRLNSAPGLLHLPLS